MLKNNILASNVIYSSIAHKKSETDYYLNSLDKIFKIIKLCEEDNKLLNKVLNNEICHTGFKRLN